jgi:hypothetical protein
MLCFLCQTCQLLLMLQTGATYHLSLSCRLGVDGMLVVTHGAGQLEGQLLNLLVLLLDLQAQALNGHTILHHQIL